MHGCARSLPDGRGDKQSIQLAEKEELPPRFILGATITQMEQFIGTPAAQNPFVSAFNDRMTAVPAIPLPRREASRAQAEQITASQIYPAWRDAIAVLRVIAEARQSRDSATHACVQRRHAYHSRRRAANSKLVTPA